MVWGVYCKDFEGEEDKENKRANIKMWTSGHMKEPRKKYSCQSNNAYNPQNIVYLWVTMTYLNEGNTV